MEFHELADIFPLLEDAEFYALVNDISKNGLHEPICLHEGKILDGRNRWRACIVAEVDPRYETYEGDDPLGYVISLNLHRRHLNETQRGVVAHKIENMQPGDNQYGHANLHDQPISRKEAAEQLNVSPRTVATVAKIEREAPDLIPQMERGEMSANKAVTELKRRVVISNLENIEQQEAKAIEGFYDVIVIDPPWPMQKIERDVAPNQVAFEYPVMTIDDISAIDLPTANDCHVWMWTTQKYLPYAFDILRDWELKYVCIFGWHKPGGFQPYNLPQYNEEFALYARKGSPIFTSQKDFKTCFNAPRGAHSEKPQEFYDMVCRVTAGRRLDMFNRRQIEGFDGWGKESI